MDAQTKAALLTVAQQATEELETLRREVMTDITIPRAVLKAAIPHLSSDARIAINMELRKYFDANEGEHPDLDPGRLIVAPLGLDALLPIHSPGWNGIPNPPKP